jgi:hypothetical protein
VAKPAVDPAVIAEAKAKAAKILAEKRAAEANAQENKEPEAK